MADSHLTEWTLDGVLHEMEVINDTMKDRQFAFILGAGASFTSGIPTGQGLAVKWLNDLHLRECADGRSLEQWITECGVGSGDLTLQTAAARAYREPDVAVNHNPIALAVHRANHRCRRVARYQQDRPGATDRK
ncbi:hypothetical protein [Pseudomonas fluorescens]|uniref:hypothetical protein n=1 Tax=Pseudomonas fluorescens TaxID=294 RepID=UPI0012426936|nr:hypothetical protein [Pseudomonas fluorescens]